MSKLGKVIIMGSCSVDYTSYSERLPSPGETIQGYKFTTTCGGKGANQCVAVSYFGGNAMMVAKVGKDEWGERYIKRLCDAGVGTCHVEKVDGCTGIAIINVAKSGENQIVVIPGANDQLLWHDSMKDILLHGSVLLCQLETPPDTTLEAFRHFKGIKILNAAPVIPNLSKELLELTTVLCVNESEAEIISGKLFSDLGLEAMLKELLGKGCQTVVITLGPKGAAFASQMDPQGILVECDKVTPVDTTGAGDAFVGALATLLSYGDETSLLQMVGAACKVASMSVAVEGTQTSYPKVDVRTLLNIKYNYSKV